MDKIDIVIPWVDGNDSEWQKEKEKYDTSTKKDYNNSSMRYRDWGTLRYTLRSIEKNLPWYNKIYLITTGHYPDWLDINHDKVVLVTHDDLYFDQSHLPIFSSSSIEMNLANIQGLSEKFIYMNDDFIIMKELNIERFFKNNKPVDFLSHGWLARNGLFKKLRGMNSWSHSIKNNLDLINQKFYPIQLDKMHLYHNSYSLKDKISNFVLVNFYKKFLWIEHWHFPQPYLRTTLIETHNIFQKEMMRCSSNRFRADNDLTQYLYRYWQLVTGNFFPYKHNDGLYCKIESKEDIDQCLESIGGYTFFCPNDSVLDDISKEENQYIEERLLAKLNEYFPNKASFEKLDN